MLEFIRLLQQRYSSLLAAQFGNSGISSIYQECFEQLRLAEAFIAKGRLIRDMPRHALQIAVIGPTQAGKSSLVNLLLRDEVAGVSPLAGFTVHPQGFGASITDTDVHWLQQFFGDFKQVKQHELQRDQYRMYSLTQLEHAAEHLPPCVIWDTPDFDSIDASGYREGVLKSIALADAVILVVSKEKYADQSVWDMMALLQPLNQPTLIVVNKLAEESQQTVLKSLHDKWRQARSDEFLDLLPLLYRQQGLTAVEQQLANSKLQKLLHAVNRRKHPAHEQQYLVRHWPQWIKPVLAEHAALHAWQQLLENSVKDAQRQYQRDYLDHPHYYETFHNALAELLTLLEIPGIARFLSGTRQALTWPVRAIMRLGSSKRRGTVSADNSHEIAVLQQIAEHQLIQISDRVLEKAEQAGEQQQWWKVLSLALRQRRGEILQSYAAGVSAYHGGFQVQIEEAAQSLYRKLQEHPLLLNGLRATRITTDAAAVALALQGGGIGLHDLVIAPAMLSLTSLLAESAIGSYMHKVQAELKSQQLSSVKQQLFENYLQGALVHLPERVQAAALFNIPEAQLVEVELQLKEKKHGLRLLGFS